MTALEACARERGLRQMIGLVLTENDDMARVLRQRGYEAQREEGDATVLRFVKAL
jgi:hypothetical protein